MSKEVHHLSKFYESYSIVKILGKGNFAEVFLCVCTLTGKKFAAKQIQKNEQTVSYLNQEIRIFRLLQGNPHSHVVACIDMFEDDNQVILVQEYLTFGDFFHFVHSRKQIQEADVKKLFLGAVMGVRHLHQLGICHRDIKLENLCVGSDGTTRVIDFNLSCQTTPGVYLSRDYCGSLNYCAPELFLRRPYLGPEIDTWSLGVVLFSLLFLRFPFEDELCHKMTDSEEKSRRIATAIVRGHFSVPKGFDVSQDALDLVKWILTVDTSKRPTLLQIMNHKWFDDLRVVTQVEPTKVHDAKKRLSGGFVVLKQKVNTLVTMSTANVTQCVMGKDDNFENPDSKSPNSPTSTGRKMLHQFIQSIRFTKKQQRDTVEAK